MKIAAPRCLVEVDDPSRDDVRRLVLAHRAWSLEQTPEQFSHSLDPQAIVEAGITLLSARTPQGDLLGIGGLKQLDAHHGEIKTMHTLVDARGRGVGRALLEALLGEARRRGYGRVSLETGTGEPFRPARSLYESAGFRPGPPFADYDNTEYNLCLTLHLTDHPGSG